MMTSDAISCRADLLRSLGEQAVRELLPSAVAISREFDIDIADRARQFLNLLMSAPSTKPNHHDAEADIEILRLYDRLAELSYRGDERAFRRLLRRLRVLQTKEATRMNRLFHAHSEISGPAFRAAKKRAERLLAKHAHTSASH